MIVNNNIPRKRANQNSNDIVGHLIVAEAENSKTQRGNVIFSRKWRRINL